MALLGGVIGGAPMPCRQCRKPFKPSSVTSSRRKTNSLICPTCKAAEKAKKKESGKKED